MLQISGRRLVLVLFLLQCLIHMLQNPLLEVSPLAAVSAVIKTRVTRLDISAAAIP